MQTHFCPLGPLCRLNDRKDLKDRKKPISVLALRSVFASQGYVVAFGNRSVENSDAAAVCDAIAMEKVPDDDDQKKT